MHDSRPGSQSLTSLPGRDVVTRREPEDIAQLASRRDSLLLPYICATCGSSMFSMKSVSRQDQGQLHSRLCEVVAGCTDPSSKLAHALDRDAASAQPASLCDAGFPSTTASSCKKGAQRRRSK